MLRPVRNVVVNFSPVDISAVNGDASFYRALVEDISNEDVVFRPATENPSRHLRRLVGKAAWKVAHARHFGRTIQPRLLALASAPPPANISADAIVTPIFQGKPRTTAPVVVCTQGVGSTSEMFESGWTRDDIVALHHRVAPSAAAWICWHDYGARGLLEVCPELSGRVHVLHPPLRTMKSLPTRGSESSRVDFLFVGSGPVARKGLPEALDAWRLLGRADASFTLVSNYDGPVPAGVTSMPLQPFAEIMRLMAAADVLVLPSHYEPYGMVVVEAYRLGCATVVSDFGCLPEVAGEGGLVAPVGDAEGIAHAFRRYLDDPELLKAKKAAGRALVSSRNAPEAWRVGFLRVLDGLATRP